MPICCLCLQRSGFSHGRRTHRAYEQNQQTLQSASSPSRCYSTIVTKEKAENCLNNQMCFWTDSPLPQNCTGRTPLKWDRVKQGRDKDGYLHHSASLVTLYFFYRATGSWSKMQILSFSLRQQKDLSRKTHFGSLMGLLWLACLMLSLLKRAFHWERTHISTVRLRGLEKLPILLKYFKPLPWVF